MITAEMVALAKLLGGGGGDGTPVRDFGGDEYNAGSVFLTKSDATNSEIQSVAIGQKAKISNSSSVAIGFKTNVGKNSVAVGSEAETNIGWNANATAIGYKAKAFAEGSIQLGAGTNSGAGTFCVGVNDYYSGEHNWTMLDLRTGLIPFARMHLVKSAMDAVAVAGAQYYLGAQSAVAVSLPSTAEVGQEISVVFYSGSTAATLSVDGDIVGDVPVPAANQRVELNLLWDGTFWALVSSAMTVEASV